MFDPAGSKGIQQQIELLLNFKQQQLFKHNEQEGRKEHQQWTVHRPDCREMAQAARQQAPRDVC